MKANKTLLLGASGLVGQAFQRIEERPYSLLLSPSHTELDLTESFCMWMRWWKPVFS